MQDGKKNVGKRGFSAVMSRRQRAGVWNIASFGGLNLMVWNSGDKAQRERAESRGLRRASDGE